MQKIFDAESESLYDFISKNGRGLYIPPYQRDYAWEKPNVERLIDDTIQGINGLLTRPEESITFIGTIITMDDVKKSTINPLVKNQVYSQVRTVIDGQQRLTTLIMLCLALLLEIETQWEKIKSSKLLINDEAKFWLETRVNDTRGLLSQMLFERQNNGEKEYRFFPKIIRAFIDTWSYEEDKAVYCSPIAWLIFEYIKYNENDTLKKNGNNFFKLLQKSVSENNNQAECNRLIKILKFMRSKLSSLVLEDDFPNLVKINEEKPQQELLFGEEFPEAMRSDLTTVLSPQSSGLMMNEGKELEINSTDDKNKQWWLSAINLVSLLIFSKFSLERITLVVVTATTEDFAFDVFEALNTTGQPLTAIETFTPKVVQSVSLTKYSSSEEKRLIDKAFSYLKKSTGAEERQRRSSELLVSFALAETGEKCSKSLADQRRFMRDAFDKCINSEEKLQFIQHLADLSSFFDLTWVDGNQNPHIGNTSLDSLTSLCIRFLVDLGHTVTVPLLAQYAAAVSSSIDDLEREIALNEFCSVVKSVVAFVVFWRSSRISTDRIDQVFRDIMSKNMQQYGTPALARSRRGERELPKANIIRKILVDRLKADRNNGGANISNKEEWIAKTVVQPIYDISKALTRFMLLAAFHDAVEDVNCLGKLTTGKLGTQSTLEFEKWISDNYATIEHIAPNSNNKGWSSDLYENDGYDRIGNLTLLPLNANQSLSDRSWEHKKVLYRALAANTSEESQSIIEKLKADSGVAVSDIGASIYCGQFLPYIHVIGNIQTDWDLQAVDDRGRNLAERVWLNLSPWLYEESLQG